MARDFRTIDVAGMRQYMAIHGERDYVLVDVRQPDEYLKGHILGSVLLPLAELPARMAELPVEKWTPETLLCP